MLNGRIWSMDVCVYGYGLCYLSTKVFAKEVSMENKIDYITKVWFGIFV